MSPIVEPVAAAPFPGRIAVVGAGAVGAYYGGRLAAAIYEGLAHLQDVGIGRQWQPGAAIPRIFL